MTSLNGAIAPQVIDSPSAWLRLGVAAALSTIGGVGMWSIMVALPAIQAEFGVSREAVKKRWNARLDDRTLRETVSNGCFAPTRLFLVAAAA